MTRTAVIRLVALGLAAAALVAAWATLGPVQVGGPVSYALVVGSSMEPKLERGDLAVTRPAADYRVGDVVLFHDRDLGRDVLHRIVAVRDGRFVTKGDNNDFRDPYHPAVGDVQGRLWVQAPALGSAMSWLRVPTHAALLVALTVLLGVAAGAGTARRMPRRRPVRRPHAVGGETGGAAVALTVGLVAIGVGAALALVAWTRPTHRPVPGSQVVQQGAFDYHAPSGAAAVYPDGAADTGEPIFVTLARTVDLRFAWRLDGAEEGSVAGMAGLDAVLSDGHGWERTLQLAPPTPFSGPTAGVDATLDLRDLQRTVAEVDGLTGAGVTTWQLRLQPRVSAHATVDGKRRDLAFGRDLRLQLDPVRLQLADGQGAAAFSPRVVQASPGTAPASLPLGLPVGWTRLLSLLVIALGFGAVAWTRAASARRDDRPEHVRIAERYGHLLIEAAAPAAGARTVELEDFQSIVRVADRADRLIVHARTELGHEYTVEDGGTLFRYRAGARVEPDAWLRVAGAQG